MKSNPEKYGRNFKTMFPKKTWEVSEVNKMIELAEELGDHNADWVEQALEWAQRIANGESWEDVCNNPDRVEYRRLVIWINGSMVPVEGNDIFTHSASYVYLPYDEEMIYYNTVPLIVV